MKGSECTFEVKSYHCDSISVLKLENLLLFLQEAASIDAIKLGFGYYQMVEIKKLWVLTNIKVIVSKMPRWNDNIVIQTWSGESRHFLIKSESGDELIRVVTDWITISSEDRRPCRLDQLEIKLPPQNSNKAVDEKLKRINPKNIQGLSKVFESEIFKSMFDVNGHVNNAEYVRLGMNALNKSYTNLEINEVQITFISEIVLGEIIEIHTAYNDKKHYAVGKRKKDGLNIFAVAVS